MDSALYLSGSFAHDVSCRVLSSVSWYLLLALLMFPTIPIPESAARWLQGTTTAIPTNEDSINTIGTILITVSYLISGK